MKLLENKTPTMMMQLEMKWKFSRVIFSLMEKVARGASLISL
jgi:hypothetical protein